MNRVRALAVSVLFFFLAALCLSATGQEEKVSAVKIGGVYPLTGPYAPMGIGDKQAIELAVEQINAQGGVKSMGGPGSR